MAATSIDLSQIKTDALDSKATFKTLIEAEGVVETIVAGTGITVDDTDPANPIVTATGGSASLTTVTITDAGGKHSLRRINRSFYSRPKLYVTRRNGG
jgi:hypothetical protein